MPSEPPPSGIGESIIFTKAETVIRYQQNQDLLDILEILDKLYEKLIWTNPGIGTEIKTMIISMQEAVKSRDIIQ